MLPIFAKKLIEKVKKIGASWYESCKPARLRRLANFNSRGGAGGAVVVGTSTFTHLLSAVCRCPQLHKQRPR